MLSSTACEAGPHPSSVPPCRHRDLDALARAARYGDHHAWTDLVRRFDPMVRSVARRYGLPPANVDDVAQATWLTAFVQIGGLRRPAAIGGWLRTIAGRAALEDLQTRVRELPTDDVATFEGTSEDDPEAGFLAAERSRALHRAMASLPEHQRALMVLMVMEDEPDYRQISATLDMPVGSIGPTRARCLARLARHSALRACAE